MDDLKLIKKYYGEKMMHFCRDNFPTVLECPGKLYKTLSKTFSPTRFLYDDIMKPPKINRCLVETSNKTRFFAIMNEAFKNDLEVTVETYKTPQELLDEAGYILYECRTEKDIQSFRHYYQRSDGKKLREYVEGDEPTPYNGEELCTFNGDRLNNCYVFFAVKKNVDKINRKDFIGKEDRQDEYGTSVISLQFAKGTNTLSIKNRYNHTVANPDATFSNNLDNIIPGLTKAFEKEYGFNLKNTQHRKDMPGYVLAEDGRYYKYNFEEDGYYFCPDNIVIRWGRIYKYDKSRFILFEDFLLDLKEKKIGRLGRNPESIEDEVLTIEVINKNKDKKITLGRGIEITINTKGRIISYKNPLITKIDGEFLSNCTEIEEIDLPNITFIGDEFLYKAENLKKINIPKVEEIGKGFLYHNTALEEISLPVCKKIGDKFLSNNIWLKSINFPKVESIGDNFLYKNIILEKLELPELTETKYCFLLNNLDIKELYLPKVKIVGGGFLESNNKLTKLELPVCEKIEDHFLTCNYSLREIVLPNCRTIGDGFLRNNEALHTVILPNCIEIGDDFLEDNYCVTKLDLPKVKRIGAYFLERNKELNEINIPNCNSIGVGFLKGNEKLKVLDLSSITHLEYIDLPKKKRNILPNNENVEIIFSEHEEENKEYPYSKKKVGK